MAPRTAKDKIYKCLNPVGNQDPVDLSPLAPRLNKLDGKTIHLSICGEPDIWASPREEAEDRLPQRQLDGEEDAITSTPSKLSDEERKTTDAVILGVCW